MLLNKIALSIVVISFAACSSTRNSGKEGQTAKNSTDTTTIKQKIDYTGAPTIVYKTSKDYKNNVPVGLSDDKTKVISYPAPTDVFYKGKLAKPVELIGGYLLDNRGVSVNIAFTKYTYEEYSKLPTAPDLKNLFDAIIDKDPITELYNCGNRNRFKDEVTELNAEIKNNQLKNYKRIK